MTFGAPAEGGRRRNVSGLDECLERLDTRGVGQLAQRPPPDLAGALAGPREALAHLFERVIGLLADAEAHAQDLLFARRQRGQYLAGLLLEIQVHRRVGRREALAVLDEVA